MGGRGGLVAPAASRTCLLLLLLLLLLPFFFFPSSLRTIFGLKQEIKLAILAGTPPPPDPRPFFAKNRNKTSDFSRIPGPAAETTPIVGALASRGGDPRERALVVIVVVCMYVQGTLLPANHIDQKPVDRGSGDLLNLPPRPFGERT